MMRRIIAALFAGVLLSAPPVGALCIGDCNGDGRVTIDELLRGVGISLAVFPPEACPALDCTGSGQVLITCLIQAVNNALSGCPLEPVAFTAALEADGSALRITPATALDRNSVYAVVLTGGIADGAGHALQASPDFRALKGSGEPVGEGPVASYESNVEAPGNPYPDARLLQDGGVRIPDRFALRGLPETAEVATARALLRSTADDVGAAGLFSSTAPIRVPLSAPVDAATIAGALRIYQRPDKRLDLSPLLHELARLGLPAGSVALAISFPTGAIEDDLLAVRARLDRRLADGTLRAVLSDPDPEDDLAIGVFQRGAPEFAEFFAANPAVATVVHGLILSPEFRGADTLFDAEKVNGVTVPADAMLDFYLTLPESPGPHRAVVVQHGFAGDNGFVLTVANDLARVGLAGIAITAVSHGNRGNVFDILTSTPLQVRDVFRQTNADQMALVRAIRSGIDVDGDGESDVDPFHIGYLGVSLGGILGATLIAVEPALPVAVLNVAGGRVAFLGDNPGTRAIYSQHYAGLAQLDIDSPEFEIFRQRILELGQQALDPADPLNYARRWRAEPFAGFSPRRVLLQEGIGDNLVSNDSTEALAAAGGLVANRAQSDMDGVSGLWRFDPPGGHGIFARADVREQAMRFLASEGTEIVDPAE